VLHLHNIGAVLFVCTKGKTHFYTPEVKLRTYYGMAFVRLSVRPSVSHIMSAQYLKEKFLSNSHGTWKVGWSWSVDDPYNLYGQ